MDVSKAGGGAAQGSGTIVSPDGIIFTCAHVVEDAGETGEIQVLTFDEYNTEPVLQYFAQVILISDDLDFAILQIHQDRSRQSITTSQLNLPYLTSWN
ncbi:MAG TPA: serine protease, partial [Syntrophorhabdaceae bacterium]|nr:serine protease [Syntrophorhabdaceae bacterium]